MASYLGEYPGCAKDREVKFRRAVDSFLANTYPDKFLVIVSDGCKRTVEICVEEYALKTNIICIQTNKQVPFSGRVRNIAIEYVKGEGDPEDIICYLDTDDRFGENHLKKIVDNFGDNDYVVYNTHRVTPSGWIISTVAMQSAHIGTSSFAHKVKLDAHWTDGYGHDWRIIELLMSKGYKYTVIPMPEYYIHHVPNFDC
jgi:glycosyltransferase involved in cell wall biosynthesis